MKASSRSKEMVEIASSSSGSTNSSTNSRDIRSKEELASKRRRILIILIGILFLTAAAIAVPLVIFRSSSTESAPKINWPSRSVYYMLTDRFSRPDSAPAPSDVKTSNPLSTFGCSDLNQYCGGMFKGIQERLGYIESMGFDTIWISSVVLNTRTWVDSNGVAHGAYHGLHASDLYQIEPNFGTAQDLIDLISACHQRGMLVIVEVVPNNMGHAVLANRTVVTAQNANYTKYFNPALTFHPFSPASPGYPNWADVVQNSTRAAEVWVDALPDIDTENPSNVRKIHDWASWLVATFKMDGLAVKHARYLPQDFVTGFRREVGVFTVGCIEYGQKIEDWPIWGLDYVSSFQGSFDTVMGFPLFSIIQSVFSSQRSFVPLSHFLAHWAQVTPSPSFHATFADHPDFPRFLSNPGTTVQLYKNVLTFVFACVGMPMLYSGSEQGLTGGSVPWNREPLWTTGFDQTQELFQFVKKLNQWRKSQSIWEHMTQSELLVSTNAYVFSRGPALILLRNTNSRQTLSFQLRSGLAPPLTKFCNFFAPTDCVTSTNERMLEVESNGDPAIYLPI